MNIIKNYQNNVRVFLFSLLPVSLKNIIHSKLKSSSITNSHVNNAITITVGMFGYFIYKLLHNHPHLLSILFSLYPIHITITYTKVHRPLPLEIRKIIMTWFYFVLWDNMTFLIKNYPLLRMTGYSVIIFKKYDNSEWTIGDYVIEKHGDVINKITTYTSDDTSVTNDETSDETSNETNNETSNETSNKTSDETNDENKKVKSSIKTD
jgi:hypothetical protein